MCLMPRTYKREFKKKICELIVVEKHSTKKTAEENNVPLKTVEKWITTYHKDNHCYDPEVVLSR